MKPYVIYLAVLPEYRQECMSLLKEAVPVELYAAAAHLDASVKTGISEDLYRPTRIMRLFSSVFLQTGHWREALRAPTTIVDLNPRSITAWMMLVGRRFSRKRTLVWGHMTPKRGGSARTAPLRNFMRGLADGAICYTYSQAQLIMTEPNAQQNVWVAANALYRARDIQPAYSDQPRTDLLYVGRFVREKKVDVLIRGFAEVASTDSRVRLVLVGGGIEENALRRLALDLGVQDRVTFAGWVSNLDGLREYYARAFASVSPGFAGLGLTQTLGFGIPQIVARGENHSPEIELAELPDAVLWFDSNDSASLASTIHNAREKAPALPLVDLSREVRELYSAERMAQGLLMSLQGNYGRK